MLGRLRPLRAPSTTGSVHYALGARGGGRRAAGTAPTCPLPSRRAAGLTLCRTAPTMRAVTAQTAQSSPPPPPRNVLEALQRAAAYLERKGVPSARLESEVLLSFVLARTRVALYTGFDQPLAPGEIDRYRALLTRRAGGEPTAYLVGEREFWSMALKVDKRVLIPRPDTERLVEGALAACKRAGVASPNVLELGTGSGAIILALAKELPQAVLTAVDLSTDALEVARENARRHGLGERITFLHGDLFAPLAADARFDLIVSNPPYIRHLDIPKLQSEVAYHEPRLALDGGDDGLDVLRRLVAEAPAWLKPDGALLCEIGMDQGDAVRALAAQAGCVDVEILRDLAGLERTLSARRGEG